MKNDHFGLLISVLIFVIYKHCRQIYSVGSDFFPILSSTHSVMLTFSLARDHITQKVITMARIMATS